MRYETIIWEQADGVGRLDPEPPRDAQRVDGSVRQRVEAGARGRSRRLRAIRAVIISGAGRGFSSGADLKQSFERPRTAARHPRGASHDVYHPAIAARRRAAEAGPRRRQRPRGRDRLLAGARLRSRVRSRVAFFGLAFVNIGLMPDGGSTAFVPPAVGKARAFQMALLGERVPAAQALEWGFVNWVLPDDRLRPEAEALAAQVGRRTDPLLRRQQAGAEPLHLWRLGGAA